MNISSMSLRQKIGQLMMVGFKGTTPSPEILQMIEEEHVGGIILFGRNIGTPEEVLQLNADLQAAAKRANHPAPLLISIDQENGVVRRLGVGTTVFPGNMLMGAVNDPEATKAVAHASAKELKALGINMNLAPVLDVNNNPHNPVIGVRSYGESVESVTRHGIASIHGHQEAGVVTTVKHFPGHGDTDTDSHLALPVISHDLDRLEQVELVPFQKAIEAGADCVMIAHVYFPALEPRENVPATISEAIVTGLLREKLGFQGVITTDCLEMNAISETIGTADGALLALKAGVDILMISHRHNWQKDAIERIVQAVEKGEISEELIDRAVERVLKLKAKYLSWDEALPAIKERVPSFVGGADHASLAQNQFDRGVTLVKNNGILPLKLTEDAKILVVYPNSQVYTMVEDARYATYALKDALLTHHSNVEELRISSPPTDDEIQSVIRRSIDADLIIFGTMNAHLQDKQAEMVRQAAAQGKPVIAIAMRNPYDLMVYPEVSAFLATYEFTLPCLRVAADILFGTKPSKGKLPVSIPGYAPIGFGL